jgi:MFS family permease
MALIYAVQGAWWPLLAVHLNDLRISGRGWGWIFATMSLAAIATPLGVGQLADRRVAAQRLMAWSYAVGAAWLAVVAAGSTTAAGPLFLLMLTYWLVTVPSYGLSNALAMRNLPDPRRQFGGVRLWGTIGWMVVGWVVSAIMGASGSGRETYEAFWVASALSAVLAVYSLTLPNTPPLATGAAPAPTSALPRSCSGGRCRGVT